LGEISPDEFGTFIGENIRLQPVLLGDGHLGKVLEFYMGKNTMDRQEFIIGNLRIEIDKVDKKAVVEETAETVVDE
jgi:topoisomerase-4 subunit B